MVLGEILFELIFVPTRQVIILAQDYDTAI